MGLSGNLASTLGRYCPESKAVVFFAYRFHLGYIFSVWMLPLINPNLFFKINFFLININIYYRMVSAIQISGFCPCDADAVLSPTLISAGRPIYNTFYI
jgi:hypothetical protein